MIDIGSLLAPHPPRTNFNLFWIDDAYTMRVAIVEDAFPWHYHPESDEGWLVLRGRISASGPSWATSSSGPARRLWCAHRCAIARWRSRRARRC